MSLFRPEGQGTLPELANWMQTNETIHWKCEPNMIVFLLSGVYADKVGIEAAEMLLRNIRHNGCVDEFLQDQVNDASDSINALNT